MTSHLTGSFQQALTREVGAALANGAPAAHVSEIIASRLDALTNDLIAAAIAQTGTPPCPWAWLALGSHGRREQVLSSDQDSAIACADGDVTTVGYFHSVAAIVVDGLAAAGFPPCPGGYVATRWCLPLADYAERFRDWVEQPEPAALLKAEVFLDVRAFHGDLDVSTLNHILTAGGARGPFTAQMAVAAVTQRPGSGVRSWPHRSRHIIDIKAAGTAPLVLLARLYALAGGSSAHDTSQRLADAAESGTLHPRTAADLADAYEVLMHERLRRQVELVTSGGPPDNLLDTGTWDRARRGSLRDALHTVREVQQVTVTRWATHTLT